MPLNANDKISEGADMATIERIRNDVPFYGYNSAGRVNAPTVEGAGNLTPEQAADKALPDDGEGESLRYPRLQWNRDVNGGKEPTYGPLYIQDKVDPRVFVQVLLEDQDANIAQYGFEATNGFKDEDGQPADFVNWHPYQYKGNWSNRLIRATAQRAMASLLYKENMRGTVNLIYMDPPYNISFRSNFQVNANSPETNETLDDVPRDGLAVKAFRDNYRNGIHSYLDGLRQQLVLARELLADDGSMIMQIGPDNLHYAALLMGEVFGMENHVATIPYRTGNMQSKRLTEIGNWLIWYEKTEGGCKYRQLYEGNESRADWMQRDGGTAWMEIVDGSGSMSLQKVTADHVRGIIEIPESARLYSVISLLSSHSSNTGRSEPFYYHKDGNPCDVHKDAWKGHKCSVACNNAEGQFMCPIGRACGPLCESNAYPCPTGKHWTVSLKGLQSIADQGRLHFGAGGDIRRKHYEDETTGRAIGALWDSVGAVRNKQYIVETPSRVLDRCILMSTDPGDLVLDLTCGSGAMPVAAERWGRRWIGVDVAAVSIAIARERIASTIYPNHMLKDSPEGAKLDYELEMAMLPPERRTEFEPREYGFDPALGFVNERQMRVSAATLAYGPDFSKDVIRHPDRVKRSNQRNRVATAFTVETDSPYRSARPEEIDGSRVSGEGDPLRDRIVESLLISGIRNQEAGHFRVDSIAPCDWTSDLTHEGEIIDPDGVRRKAVFYIGAEDETISRARTNYAVNRAREGFGAVEVVVMIGFNRDANALKSYQLPSMRVLQVAANMDLQLGGLDTAADDNAFVVVSEPDIRLHRLNGDGRERVQVEALGISCFNPASGLIEAQSAHNRQIMGMMIDSNYDGESFRARLMNVMTSNRNRKTLRDLKKAFLKIDGELFAAMQTNKSLPFDLPEPGVKIAVKVIDLTGMEHMAVIDDPRDKAWYVG